MKLSILIPMYNAQDFISRCLDSLLQQKLNYDEYEILVMDDGSTDKSVEIVEEYAKQHSQIHLYTKKSEGAYSTRNRLLPLAKGEYIYNVDADDYVKPYTLHRFLEIGVKNKVDLIGFKTSVTKSVEIPDDINDSTVIESPEIISGIEFLKKYRDFRVEIWWYLIRREFLERNQFKFSDNEYNADVIFTINCYLEATKVMFFPVVNYFYYQSPHSIMRSNDQEKNIKRIEYSYDMIMDFSKLINKISDSFDIQYKGDILKNLSFRRDTFLFFLLIRIIRTKFKTEKLRRYINSLKALKAYPLKNFMCKEHNTLNYKTLLFIINHSDLLKLANRLSNIK